MRQEIIYFADLRDKQIDSRISELREGKEILLEVRELLESLKGFQDEMHQKNIRLNKQMQQNLEKYLSGLKYMIPF